MLSNKMRLLACLAATLAWFATPALAQQVPNQPTYFTFSQPVSLPGITLPAGKYEFRLANSLANRHIVQIFTADGSKILATIFAIPALRSDVPNSPEIRFMETAATAPPAIQTWWYPGTKTGHEFIYPKGQAEPLAQLNPGVLTTETEPRTGELERLARTGEAKPVETLPATTTLGTKTVVGEPAPVPTPAIQPVEPSQAQAVTPTPRRHLPKTAGNLPAALIVGILSLAAGGTMAFWRRRDLL